MTLFIKFLLVGKILVSSLTTTNEEPLQKESPFTYKRVSSFNYKSKPVIVYKSSGPDAEITYKIVLYSDPALRSPQQTLVIRKADEHVKIMIGANYILSELSAALKYINYPYAWEVVSVDLKDLKEDCINIFGKDISPLKD